MLTAVRISLATAMLMSPGLLGELSDAMAASPTDSAARDGQSDRIRDLEDAIDAAQDAAQERRAADLPTPSAPREFNFRVTAPLYFNSNPKEVQSSGPSALEGDPELELGWGSSLTSVPLKISVKFKADTDRLVRVPEAGEDEFSGSFKISYYNAQNDCRHGSPFVSYKGSAEYEATFSLPGSRPRTTSCSGLDKVFNFSMAAFIRYPPCQHEAGRTCRLEPRCQFLYVQRLPARACGSQFHCALRRCLCSLYAGQRLDRLAVHEGTRERWFDTVTSSTTTTSRRDF